MDKWLTIVGVSEAGPKALPDAVKLQLFEAKLIVAAKRFHAGLNQMIGNQMIGNQSGNNENGDSAIIISHDQIVDFPSPLADFYPQLDQVKGQPVCVLATGDPLWFGIGASLIKRYGAQSCNIIPNVSGIQMAAARMGWPIASCKILTIHGRAIEAVLPSCQRRARLLVIAENGQSAPKIAQLLTDYGYGDAEITALAHLGGDDEALFYGRAAAWAHQVPDFHILAISLPDQPASQAGFALTDADIENDGKLTKADCRASAVAKLRPFAGAVMWDVGAGSGAVAIEFMRLAPRSRAYAIDKDQTQIEMARRNAKKFGVPNLTHIHAELPSGLSDLPTPDAIFIGGGLSAATIDECLSALRDGGVLVAHAVTLESEALMVAAWQAHGGKLARISVHHADPVGGFHGWRPLMPVTQWHFIKSDGGLATPTQHHSAKRDI